MKIINIKDTSSSNKKDVKFDSRNSLDAILTKLNNKYKKIQTI